MNLNHTMSWNYLVFCVFSTLSCLIAPANTLHVWQGSPSPGPPYDSWATAAHVIQDAVDVAVDGDTVLVTNGVYATGGRAVHGTMTNRVAIDRAITLSSVNGPEVTVIDGAQAPMGGDYGSGDGALRCVHLGTDAVLNGDGDGIAQLDMGAYEYAQPDAEELLETLIGQVTESDLPQGRKTALLASLHAAQASLDRGNRQSGMNQLRVFQNKNLAQVTREDADLAVQLLEAAEQVIGLVGE